MQNIPIHNIVVLEQRIAPSQFLVTVNHLMVLNNKPFIGLNSELHELDGIKFQNTPNPLNSKIVGEKTSSFEKKKERKLQVVVREKGCWEKDVCVGLGAFRGSPT
jgi:hypothetical protein